MSFWLEDDDIHGTSQSQQQQQESEFFCEQCGSTESYLDSTTGHPTCSQCFTQHNATQQSQEMDYDDVVGLAARTRAGGLLQRKQRLSGGQRTVKTKLPLQDIDSSAPLPSTETCIQGMQCILRNACEKVIHLMNCDDELGSTIHDNVRKLWFGYLCAWTEGAETYGAKHPDVRICFRDLFVPSSRVLAQLYKYLSYKATQAIVEKHQKYKRGKRGKGSVVSEEEEASDSDFDDASYSDTDINDEDEDDEQGKDSRKRKRLESRRLTALLADRLGKHRGHQETALQLRPNMALVAAILYLAVSRRGISSARFCSWLLSGDLPLYDAYSKLLSIDLQHALAMIQGHFRMLYLLSSSALESHALMLAVACRKRVFVDDKSVFWSQAVLPVLLAELLAILFNGVANCQFILDCTLSLLGLAENIPKENLEKKAGVSPNHFSLPKPIMPAVRCHRLHDILALIAIACQCHPSWRDWKYVYRQGKTSNWNDVSHFTNGTCLTEYLDFIENFPELNRPERKQDEFLHLLKRQQRSPSKLFVEETDKGIDVAGVSACSTIAGEKLGPKPSFNDRYINQQDYSKSHRIIERSMPSRGIVDPQQVCLLEYISYMMQISVSELERSYRKLLSKYL